MSRVEKFETFYGRGGGGVKEVITRRFLHPLCRAKKFSCRDT